MERAGVAVIAFIAVLLELDWSFRIDNFADSWVVGVAHEMTRLAQRGLPVDPATEKRRAPSAISVALPGIPEGVGGRLQGEALGRGPRLGCALPVGSGPINSAPYVFPPSP